MKDLRLWLCILPLIFILSACGADLKMSTSVEPNGAGERRFTIEVKDDQMKEVKGGEPALTQILTEKKPDDSKLEKKVEQGKTTYTYSFSFKSLEELNSKSEKWLGSSPGITFKKEGTPFSRKYTFNDPNSVRDYMKWASKAVYDEGLISKDYKDNMINSDGSEVQLPGDDKKMIQMYGKQPTQTEKHYPVQSIKVETDIHKENSFIRRIKITLQPDIDKQILSEEQDAIERYLQNISKDATVTSSESGAMKEYVIALQADAFDKLQDQSKLYLNNKDGFFDMAKKSMFFPIRQYKDRADLSFLLGNRVQVKDGFTYQLLFDGKIVSLDGKGEVVKEKEPVFKETTLTQPNPNISMDVYIQKTTALFYVSVSVLILLGIGTLAVLIILYKKYPDKFSIKRLPAVSMDLPEKSSSVANKFCYDCGQPLEPQDQFCYHCGHKNQLERGA